MMETDAERKLAAEVDRLEECLHYLASCQSATAESMPARISKSERRRQASICEKALGFIRGGRPERPSAETEHRLKRAIEICLEPLTPTKDTPNDR